MSINQQALALYEDNQYEAALEAFQLAVDTSRDVQALHNLAWILMHEAGEMQQAKALLLEAIQMQPNTYFPYYLLGEIYLEQGQWQCAVEQLSRGIEIARIFNGLNNMGVACYHLRLLDQAAHYFLEASRSHSDYAAFSHIRCLIELGKDTEARVRLALVDEQDEAFTGYVELAELYYELQDYAEAVRWYARGWRDYYKQPSWINSYVYALCQVDNRQEAAEKLAQALQDKQLEYEDTRQEPCTEVWTADDKQQQLVQLADELQQYQSLMERIESGYVPTVTFTTSISSGCYLFGCVRHQHPEYTESG